MTNSKHAVLAMLDAELAGIRVADTVDVAGHKFGLKVLERHEESYARSLFPPNTSVLQAFSDQSLPVLAVALQSVDGVRVEELFTPGDKLDNETLKMIQTDDGLLRWRREAALQWLNDKPGTFVEELWHQYMELKRKSQQLLEDMRPFSKKTPSGGSEPTSLPEKESSSLTPVSNG